MYRTSLPRRRDLLERLPALATTGIGSLPFADPAEAVAHVWASYDVPFCPQLPALEGDAARVWLGRGSRRCGWSPERDRQRPIAWPEVLCAVQAVPPAHGIVKLQVVGPWTLAHALARDGAAAGPRRLARELGAWIAANVLGCIADLRSCGAEVLVVADEPALVNDAGSAALAAWEPLRTVAPLFGVHVCGPPPWALLAAAEPDILFLDLHRFPLDAHAVGVLAGLVRGGGRVGLGLAPVGDGEDPAGAAQIAAGRCQVAFAAAGIALSDIARAALVTPACGTGPAMPATERSVSEATSGIAALLRERSAFASQPVNS